MSVSFLRQLLMKEAVKKSAGSSGIMSINKNIAADVDKLLQKYINDAMQQGVDIETLSPDQLKMIVAINQPKTPRVIPGSSVEGKAITEKLFGKKGEVVDFPQPKTFKQEIDAMKKSGDIVDSNNLKKNDKVLTREMFRDSNLNKPTIEGQMEKINKASNRIEEIKKEQADMYKPKSDAEIKAKYDKQNKESIQKLKNTKEEDRTINEMYSSSGFGKDQKIDAEFLAEYLAENQGKIYDDLATKEKLDFYDRAYNALTRYKIDNSDFAKGGRAGFYTGGITDVEPRLDDIGHGSDSLMSRTRLMSPGAQATTSTGLNYLLAEDNDNLRVPFSAGGDPKRRAFLKLLATLTGGAAAFKTGLLNLGGKETTKKAVTETIKQSAGSGTPPPYFFKLVDKIKSMGDDITEKAATKDREVVTRYKDFELTEDVATGEQTIQRIKTDTDAMYYDETLAEDVYMNYKPAKGQADETAPKVADEYTEDTSYLRTTGPQKGDIYDTVEGVPDDILEEVGEIITKKADGGRIGFRTGGSGKKFIEKIFGKGSLDVMKSRDPELHKGMLEVVEMFRNRDKEGLKMYLQKFLPHMDDETIEAFIVGDAVDAAGQGKYGLDNIQGQLIRLGSGRDYAGKIEAMKKLDNAKKLDTLDVTEEMIRKPNASGGIQTMLGE